MSKRFLSGINVTGTATLNTVANAGLDTDKFLVLDAAGNIDFRTGDELKIDIGANVVSRIEHEVKLGETMTIGTPVYIGVDLNAGTNMTVYKATNATEAGSSKTIGLIASSGITNDLVKVITEGLLEGLNTSTATKGDPVWLGVNGALLFGLANKPVAPAHMVFLGIVTRVQQNNGEIFVKVQNGFEMNEIHNYLQGSVQNNEVIVYESATSLYKPKTIPTILGYTPVPDSRTITINGTSYDLSANRSWTITTDASARSILRYVATANQTTFTISGGYTPGLTDVYRNGVKLDNSTDFTATNGTTIVLTNGASVNDVIEVYRYQTAFLANNALRTVTEFIATAGQTTFSVTYNSGLVDVFYNGSKLLSTEYTAGNGTSIVLNFPCNVNDTLEVHAYSYAVGAFTGQAQLNGTGFVKVSGTTVTYDNSTYLTSINSSQVTTALGYTPYNATNPSGYITSSALSSYLPLSGGTLTGTLGGTSASFSKSTNSGSGSVFPRLQIENTLATQGDGSSTFNFADIRIASGNSAVQMFLATTFASGTWSPAGIINVSTNHELQFKTNNTTRFTISPTGISTFSGDYGSSSGVSLSGTTYAMYGVNRGALNASAGMNYFSIGTQKWFTGIYENTDNFGFYNATNATFPVVITTGNNMGIGTISPEGPLHVNGAIGGGYIGMAISNSSNTIGTTAGIDFGADISTSYNGAGNGQIAVTNVGGVGGGQSSEMNLRIWNGAALVTGIRISNTGRVSFPTATAQNYGLSNSTAITINSGSNTVASCTITSVGKPIFVNLTGDINPVGGPSWCYIYIYRNGSPIGKYIIAESPGASTNIPFALTTIDIPGAGTHTYTGYVTIGGANPIQFGETGNGQAPTILAVELI